MKVIMRKGVALLMALAMAVTMLPADTAYAGTSDASAGGNDAFAALGIDTSAAPEGFDENSIENPYGRDTIKLNTVSELYTVQLGDAGKPSADLDATVSVGQQSEKADAGTCTYEKNTSKSLTASLYGDGVGYTSTRDSLGTVTSASISSNTTVTGNYIRLNQSGQTHSDGGQYSIVDYQTGIKDVTSEQGVMFDVAAGNFDGNTEGKSAQVAMVYAKDYSGQGGLYLRFGDTTSTNSDAYGASIELLSPGKAIGNPTLEHEGAIVENFAENPYQLKNYLQVATGDWNGDGVDEVAVYIPEEGNSRIAVYAYLGDETSYKDPSKWSLAWTYYLEEENVVSNMISMVSGDVDKDGIDDLACTWGYYYGPEQNKSSTAVVMFGGKGTDILKRYQQFYPSYGGSNIVRASFVFGDIGAGEESLILCGQSNADLKAGNKYTRYVALYTWNGTSFEANIAKNFDLFDKDDDGNWVYKAMKRNNAEFYSLPLCPANTAIITKGIQEDGGNKLYFDSLIFTYTDDGLTLKETWDNQAIMTGTANTSYVEYDGAAGDMTGVTGAGVFMTVTQTVAKETTQNASYTEAGSATIWVSHEETYYKNWWNKLWGKKSTRVVWEQKTVSTSTEINQYYVKNEWGDTKLVTVEMGNKGAECRKTEAVNASFSLCFANTDNDSSYMRYNGSPTFRYTDPQVLAVLASPPYFKDLLDRDDLSGNYAESTTSYSSTDGSESGEQCSATISAGVYVGFEQEFSVFGVVVASFEAETVITAGFTWETEHTSSLEQTVSYSATSGEDKVALYSIPMEIYKYTSYVPDGKGDYKEIITEVNIPHEACVKLLDLSEYEAIAEDYSVLPQISDSVLTHEIGDPSTYPSSTTGYDVIAQYTGTPASVGFTSKGGGDTITQEIAMSTSNSTSYTASSAIESKVGGGAGGAKVGVVAGSDVGAGCVQISTSGSSFSGELQAMPAEAESYGYAMNWKIFCYKYSNGSMTFPVVSYLVSEVKQPASLPEDFGQNVEKTTDESITLSWTYDKYASGFQLYRYYEFPDGSGSYRLQYVPFSSGKYDSKTGRYVFEYTDTGLSPYTEYKYQIQTESTTSPTVSIYSEPIVCRTKTLVGYPTLTVSGLNDEGKLAIYPDAEGEATVTVANPEEYKSISYQWQKLSDGSWENLPAFKTNTLKIVNASAADKGTYRCLVNVIYYDETSATEYYISAYTNELETVYTKRTPAGTLTVSNELYGDNKDKKGIHAEVEFHSANLYNTTAPLGTVTFTVTGADYEYSETKTLQRQDGTKEFVMGTDGDGVEIRENKYYSKAAIDLFELPDGAYTVTYYYSGDKNFKDETLEIGTMAIIGNATGYTLHLTDGTNSFTKCKYGTTIVPKLYSATSTASKPEEVASGRVTYKIKPQSGTERSYKPSEECLDVGTYTVSAYIDGGVTAVAEAELVIEKKPLLVKALKRDNVSVGDVDSTAPKLVSDADEDEDDDAELEALGITYQAYNSAGTKTTLSGESNPGNYTIMPCFMEERSETQIKAANNYEVTFESAVYTIIGSTFELTVVAEKYVSGAVEKTVGTAGISSLENATSGYFANGTAVQLYAEPDAGYAVDYWQVEVKGSTPVKYDETKLTNVNRLNLTMKPAETIVRVYFKVQDATIKTMESEGGSVTCISDPYFSSGAAVSKGAEFEFQAVPDNGYSFDKWEINEIGKSTVYQQGTANEDGSNNINIVVGTSNIDVKALFVRDSYMVHLDGEVCAYYNKQGDTVDSYVKKYISDGDRVTGDTIIYVTPKVGYTAAEGQYICINGESTEQSDSYRFKLEEDTTISLATVRENYTVEASSDGNGLVSITADDELISSGATVLGGSKVVFQATANRGYLFDHWVVGEDVSNTEESLTIEELGASTSVSAVFRENSKHTVTTTISPESRGTMTYTIRDLYGNVVGEEWNTYTGSFDMYEGETIDFKVANKAGSMVEQWVLEEGGKETRTVSTSKTYPGGSVTMSGFDIDVTVYMVAATYYNLYFNSADENGTLTATADGEAIVTGDKLAGGSEIVFTATPEQGYMVDYWTVTAGSAGETENEDPLYQNEIRFVDPVYTIPGLNGNWTVRAHFTAIETKTINITGENATADITYMTPVNAAEDTDPVGTNVAPRTGATVKLTVTPRDGFATSEDEMKAAVSDCCERAEVVYESGTYMFMLYGVKDNLEFGTDNYMDPLYKVSASEHSVITELTSDKTADGAGTNEVREGSVVTFKLSPVEGYEVDGDAFNEILPQGASVSEDFTVTISGITEDFTVEDDCIVKKTVTPGGDGETTGGDGIGGGGTGGGGAIPSGGEEVTEAEEVVTSKDSETNANITVVSTEVKVKDGTVNATVKTENVVEAIKQAVDNKSEEIVFNIPEEDSGNADKVQLVISKSEVQQIVDKTSAALSVTTIVGEVTISQDALEKIVSTSEGQDLAIEIGKVTNPTAAQKNAAGENGSIVEVTILSKEKAITSFGGNILKIRLEVPSTLENKNVVAIHIAENGTIEKMTGKKIKDGTKEFYEFDTNHLSTFALVDGETLEDDTPAVTIPKKGSLLTDTKTKMVYKVTKSGKTGGTVQFVKAGNTKAKTITIPATVTIDGITYKVTSIAANALKNNKTVTKVVIGKNVKKIGKYAFKGCTKLTSIKLNTSLLTAKTVSEYAFTGVSTKVVVSVPKSKLKAYKKMLVEAGLDKKIKIKSL